MIMGCRKGVRRGMAERRWSRALAAAATVASVVLLCACGSSKPTHRMLDVAKVEHAIEHSIMRQRHLVSSVICPPKVPQRPGRFACIATTVSRRKPHREIKTPFLVTVLNDKGRVRYVGESLAK